MAVEPVTEVVGEASAGASWIDSLLRPVFQNIVIILLFLAVVIFGIIGYAMWSKKQKEKDPFLAEFNMVKKDLLSNAPPPKRLPLNVFEPLGLLVMIILATILYILAWLFDLTMVGLFVLFCFIGYLAFDKLGLFSAYTTRVYLASDDSTKFLGYYVTDMIQPKGWHDFLLTKSKWMKKYRIIRVNASGEEKITQLKPVIDKDKKKTYIKQVVETIALPINLIKKSPGVILIKGRDTRTYRYFEYVTHVDKYGQPIDLDLVIANRDVMRIKQGDIAPVLADDFTQIARKLIGTHPEVAKALKTGGEGVEEDT